MDPIITTKLGAMKQIAENLVIYAEMDDYESATQLALEVQDLEKITTDKVKIEECPMSGSGIIIRPFTGKED